MKAPRVNVSLTRRLVRAVALVAVVFSGCQVTPTAEKALWVEPSDVPRELAMVSHPTYRVAPPDILLVEAVRLIRRPESLLEPGDTLVVRLANPEPLEPTDANASAAEAQFRAEVESRAKLIDGDYLIQPSGEIDLGPLYNKVMVAGFTVEETRNVIKSHLEASGLANAQISVSWSDFAGKQEINGDHLVRSDGTISLGIYGNVHVAGLMLHEVRGAVEACLSQSLVNPQVNVDVTGYNSKSYYVILDGGGRGEQVRKLPITGNEHILDAISAVDGLSEVSSKRMWVARPAPPGTGVAQILPVNWHDITVEGISDTNYQILPGDRLYVQADRLIEIDTFVEKLVSPFERIFSTTLLGTSTARGIKFFNQNQGGGGNSSGRGF